MIPPSGARAGSNARTSADPLDMPETSHYPADAQMPRFVTAYGMANGGLVETQNSLSMSSKVYFAGGGGLVSTVDDYSHFAQMLANGGAFNGKRLLSRKTVEMMSAGTAHNSSMRRRYLRAALGRFSIKSFMAHLGVFGSH